MQLAPGRLHVPAFSTPPGGMPIHVQVVDVFVAVNENGGHVAVTLPTKYVIKNNKHALHRMAILLTTHFQNH